MAKITVYADVIMPNSVISAGISGKLIRKNRRAAAQDGRQQITAIWSNTLRQFTVGTCPMTVAQWQALEGLYEVTDAGTYGFLMQDPKDCSADHTTGKVSAMGVGSPDTYQLVKRYTSVGSSRTKDRTIRRPKAVGFILKISGAPTTSFTLNADTGVLAIPAQPAAADVTWSGIFYVPVHFANDDIDWDLVRAGQADTRLMAGPSVVLDEVRE